MDKSYEKLAKEVSEKYHWKIDNINGNVVFWVPWEQTGAFTSLNDARENSINMNNNDEVSWAYSKDDLKELLCQT